MGSGPKRSGNIPRISCSGSQASQSSRLARRRRSLRPFPCCPSQMSQNRLFPMRGERESSARAQQTPKGGMTMQNMAQFREYFSAKDMKVFSNENTAAGGRAALPSCWPVLPHTNGFWQGDGHGSGGRPASRESRCLLDPRSQPEEDSEDKAQLVGEQTHRIPEPSTSASGLGELLAYLPRGRSATQSG